MLDQPHCCSVTHRTCRSYCVGCSLCPALCGHLHPPSEIERFWKEDKMATQCRRICIMRSRYDFRCLSPKVDVVTETSRHICSHVPTEFPPPLRRPVHNMFRSSVGAVPPYSFGYSRVGLHWSRNNTSCIDHREVIIDERLSRTTVGASTADTFTVFLDVPRVNNTAGNE